MKSFSQETGAWETGMKELLFTVYSLLSYEFLFCKTLTNITALKNAITTE